MRIDMNHSIDKHNIILTKSVGEYSLLAAIPRNKDTFESYSYWSKVDKLSKIIERIKEVIIDTRLLSYEAEASAGSVVEIECAGGTGNVIKWIRWKDDWYIIDIFKELV
jgi:hypothetical protein